MDAAPGGEEMIMKAIGLGRLTGKPEVRYSQGSAPMAYGRFDIACERRFRKEGDPEADFFTVKVFGKQAEWCEKYLDKGRRIQVTGTLHNYDYVNKDGQKVRRDEIVADLDGIEFADSNPNAQGQAQNQTQQAFQSRVQAQAPNAARTRATKPAPQAQQVQPQPVPQAVADQQAAFVDLGGYADLPFLNQ